MVLWFALMWQLPGQQSNLPASIAGRVVWQGKIPALKPFLAPASPGVNQADPGLKSWPNPMAPAFGPGGEMGKVLVWLEGEAGESRSPVRVKVKDNQILVEQGGLPVPVGLMGQGDSIVVESHQDALFTLKGRGANSFALPLLEKGKLVTRKLEKAGWVELSSGSGQYWARAWLWVGAPGKAVFTDMAGNFEFGALKPGKQKIYARLPDWRIGRFERDQETGEILLAEYGKPRVEMVETELKSGVQSRVDIVFRAAQP